MKRTELALGSLAFLLLLTLMGQSWFILMKIVLGVALVGVVLHWKISPYKNQLNANYKKIFDMTDSVMKVILPPLRNIPNIQLGAHMQLDMSYTTLIVVLTTILIIL